MIFSSDCRVDYRIEYTSDNIDTASVLYQTIESCLDDVETGENSESYIPEFKVDQYRTASADSNDINEIIDGSMYKQIYFSLQAYFLWLHSILLHL